MRSLYKKLSDWIQKYPALSSWVYFNSTDMEEGCTSLNSNSSHRKTKEYIDGSYEALLPFGIVMVKPYDNEQSTVNQEAYEEASAFMDWVENNEEYPDFGEKYKVTDLYLLDQNPTIMVDTQQSLAKYTFYGEIEYCYNN